MQVLAIIEQRLEKSNCVAFMCDAASSEHVLALELSILCSHIPFTCVVDISMSNVMDADSMQTVRRIDCSDLLTLRAIGCSDNVVREMEQVQIKTLLNSISNRCNWSISEVVSYLHSN